MMILDIPDHQRLSDFEEKQLTVEIQNLQDLELILSPCEDTEGLVWLPQREAFLSNVSQFGSSVHIDGYLCPTMEVEWSDERCERFSYWHVYAKSLTVERETVAHLLTVPDACGFTSVSVTSMLEDEGTKDLFPCSPDQVNAIFFNNIDRELHIHNFALDESQSVALVEVDLPLHMKLSSCEFLTNEATDAKAHCAFNDALQQRTVPIQSLAFVQDLPFARTTNWQRQIESFWNIVSSGNLIDALCLEEIDISKENGFGDMSSVPLKTLCLSNCTFGHQGAGIETIAEIIHCGCVSEGLTWNGLDSLPGPSWYVLACAIANCQLSEFRLANVSTKWAIPVMMGVLEMVHRNAKLQRLCAGDVFNFSPDAWQCLMAAVSNHPTLQFFQVDNMLEGIPQDFPAAALKPLTDMMKTNRNIEVDVPLCRYKRKFGDDDPIERLQKINRFSRQVEKLGQLDDLDYRLALIGKSAVASQSDFRKLSLLIAGHADLLVPSIGSVYNEEEKDSLSNKRARTC